MNNSIIGINILDYTGNSFLSGYTLPITPFTFTADTSDLDFVIKNILWDFGDGTTSTSITATHVYQWPGNYPITLSIVDVNGILYKNSFIPVLSVFDLIDNKLYISSISTPVYDVGTGNVRDPITVVRYNSWQSYNTLSATGYTIYPYASGALANYLNTSDYYSSQWSHLVPYNKFLQPQSINGNTQFTVVSNYKTIDTLLYAAVVNNTLTLCSSSVSNSIFVGTSGFVDTYFTSDIPKNFDSTYQPVILFYSLSNNSFSDLFTIKTNYYNSITANNINYVNIKPAILPSVKVRPSPARKLSFTTNGLDTEGTSILSTFNLPQISWQGEKIPFVVKLKDNNGFSTKYYPILSSNTQNQNCNSLTFNISTNLCHGSTIIPGVSFYTDNILNADINSAGYFKGYFVSPVSSLNCYLSATVNVQEQPSFNIDTVATFFYSIDQNRHNFIPTSASYQLDEFSEWIYPLISDTTNVLQHNQVYTLIWGSNEDTLFRAGIVPDLFNPGAGTITVFETSDGNCTLVSTASGNVTAQIYSGNLYADVYTTRYNSVYNSLTSSTTERQITAPTTFSFGSLETIPQILVSPISPNSQKQYGIWIIDEIGYKVWSIDITGKLLKTYDLTSISLSSINGLQASYDFTPDISIQGVNNKMSGALDSNNNIWLSLFGTGSAIRINTQTDVVDAVLNPNIDITGTKPLSSVTYYGDFAIGFPSTGVASPYSPFFPHFNSNGDYLSGRAIMISLDTDKDNNIWGGFIYPDDYRYQNLPILRYTHYGLLVKFNQTGKILKQILLPPSSVPRNIVVDRDNIVNTELDYYGGWNLNDYNSYIWRVSSTGELLNVLSATDIDDSFALGLGLATSSYLPLLSSENLTIDIQGNLCSLNTVLILNPENSVGGTAQRIRRDSLGSTMNLYLCTGVSPHFFSWSSFVTPRQYNPNYIISSNSRGITSNHIDLNLNIVDNFGGIDQTAFLISGSLSANYLTGIYSDTYNQITIVDSISNRLVHYNNNTPTVSSLFTFYDNLTALPLGGLRGDPNGFKFISKYAHVPSNVVTVTGSSTSFNIYPSGGYNYVAKINENFDANKFYNSLRLQESLLDKNQFFDDFLGTIVGTASSIFSEPGKNIYEKISNFIDNNKNVDTANINALISFCNQFSFSYEPLNFNFPPNLRKVLDLLSINFKKLYGTKNTFTGNFDKKGAQFSNIFGLNLGNKINLLTDTFSLSEKIVTYEKYSNTYKLTQTAQLSGYTLSSTLPFSAFSNNWGWGLVLPQGLSGTNAGHYYDFYRYVNVPENTVYDSVINWTDFMTTVSYISTNYTNWVKDDGVMDTIINYNLSRGLNLLPK